MRNTLVPGYHHLLLQQRPGQMRRSWVRAAHDSIKVMTLHNSKGLEFPVVALVCNGRMLTEGEDEREEARLFYVGAIRATQRLIIGVGRWGRAIWGAVRGLSSRPIRVLPRRDDRRRR